MENTIHAYTAIYTFVLIIRCNTFIFDNTNKERDSTLSELAKVLKGSIARDG